jgi:hypothetical protein
VLEGVDAVEAELGGDDDSLTLSGRRLHRHVHLDGGPGDDRLHVRSSKVAGGIDLIGGPGDDALLVTKGDAQAHLAMAGGEGEDTYRVSTGQLVGGRLAIEYRAGPRNVTAALVRIRGELDIRTADAVDRVLLSESMVAGEATVHTADGDDEVTARQTGFRRGHSFDLGGDAGDVEEADLTLAWGFRDGLQGWEPLFADYTEAHFKFDLNGDVLDDQTIEEQWELRGEIAPLPAGLPREGALVLGGENASDDLYTGAVKRLGIADGLVPNQTYELTYDIAFASDKPVAAPGEGVGGNA